MIFLDEPTTGLDPRSRRTMWQSIRDLAAGGTTIFLTTQYLDEADQLADRIAILDRGRIVAQGTPGELKRRMPGGHIRLHFADPGTLDAAARLLDAGPGDHEHLTLQVPGDSCVAVTPGAAQPTRRRRHRRRAAVDPQADLDDVFLALTGHATTQEPPSHDHLAYTLTDSATMLRRDLRRLRATRP